MQTNDEAPSAFAEALFQAHNEAEPEAPDAPEANPEGEIPPESPAVTTSDTEPTEDVSEGNQPLTVKDLAKKLGLSAKELYEQVTLDVNGSPMTLGEFKDRAKELQRADKLLTDAETQRIDSENAVLRGKQELAYLEAKLGRQPTQAEREEAAKARDDYIERENRRAIEAIPDWSDAAVQRNDIKAMSQLLRSYGFTDADIGNVVDHRHVKLLRDYSVLRERLKSAEKAVSAPKRDVKPRRRPQVVKRDADRMKADYEAGRLSKEDYMVGVLLNGTTQNGD